MSTKSITLLLATAIVLTVYILGLPSPKPKAPISPQKPAPKPSVIVDAEAQRLERRRELQEQEELDSVHLSNVMIEVLQIASERAADGPFELSYAVDVEEGSQIQVEIQFGYVFTRQSPHLIIRRTGLGEINIDIFRRRNQSFEPVLVHSQWGNTYVGDTIQDVNGDGRKDFVVNWYGMTGCCLKAFSDVYLLRSDGRSFSKGFEFINPTFAPGERVVRGVCYGHPGATEMYKYRWNGEAIDTLAYIGFELDSLGEKTGRYVVRKERHGDDLRILNKMPAEYKRIDGYDWFMGDFQGD